MKSSVVGVWAELRDLKSSSNFRASGASRAGPNSSLAGASSPRPVPVRAKADTEGAEAAPHSQGRTSASFFLAGSSRQLDAALSEGLRMESLLLQPF